MSDPLHTPAAVACGFIAIYQPEHVSGAGRKSGEWAGAEWVGEAIKLRSLITCC